MDRSRQQLTRISRRDLLKWSGAFALATGGIDLLAACSSPTTTSASPAVAPSGGATATTAPKVGGQAVIASSSALPDVFVAGAENVTVARIYNKNWIGDALVRVRQPEWTAAPSLAESWTSPADGLTYSFKLRQGVKFHDGRPFSAADVKFTYEYLAHPKFPVPLPSHIANIVGAREYKAGSAKEITGISTSGDDQVRFSITERTALFINTTAAVVILPRHLLKDVDPASVRTASFATKPIYTGPFMLDDWKPAEFISFKANPDYFAGRPYLGSIILRIIPDQTVVNQMLRTGEIIAGSIPADVYESFKKDPDFNVFVPQQPYPGFIEFDIAKGVLSDISVRQAFSHAIDRETLTKTLFRGLATPGLRFIDDPSSPWFNPKVPTFPYDPARAKELLDQAGWKPGTDGIRVKNGKRLEFLVDVTPGSNTTTALALLPMAQAVGITFKLNTLDFGAWLARLGTGEGKHEASPNGATSADSDPRFVLAATFESPRATGPDRTGFRNDEVNQLFKQARLATTPAEEKKAYDRILEIADAQAIMAYTWFTASAYAYNKKLVLPRELTNVAGPLDPHLWSLR